MADIAVAPRRPAPAPVRVVHSRTCRYPHCAGQCNSANAKRQAHTTGDIYRLDGSTVPDIGVAAGARPPASARVVHSSSCRDLHCIGHCNLVQQNDVSKRYLAAPAGPVPQGMRSGTTGSSFSRHHLGTTESYSNAAGPNKDVRLVQSPYVHDEAPVDISHLAAGSMARCPYTDHFFIVPPKLGSALSASADADPLPVMRQERPTANSHTDVLGDVGDDDAPVDYAAFVQL